MNKHCKWGRWIAKEIILFYLCMSYLKRERTIEREGGRRRRRFKHLGKGSLSLSLSLSLCLLVTRFLSHHSFNVFTCSLIHSLCPCPTPFLFSHVSNTSDSKNNKSCSLSVFDEHTSLTTFTSY